MPRRSASRLRLGGASFEFLESTAEAAFVSDEKRHIVAWSRSATTLLGFEAGQVVGRPCHQVVQGTDLSGNRFCSERCAVRQMVRRHEAVHAFPIRVPSASGPLLTVRCSVVVVPESRPGKMGLLHLLLPAAGDHQSGGTERSAPESSAPAGAPDPATPASPGCPRPLTARQTEVLHLMAAGMSHAEMASLLSISPATVGNHVQHILAKLEVHNRLHAIVVAHRLKLI